MTYYVHQIPGRVRIRIPQIRTNPSLAAEIESMLSLVGVKKVEVNPMTGSVTVSYNPQLLDADHLLRALRDAGCYDESRTVTCDDRIQQAAHAAAARAGRAFFGWAVGKALEQSGLSLLAAFI
jgi:copper chaperone CopZ